MEVDTVDVALGLVENMKNFRRRPGLTGLWKMSEQVNDKMTSFMTSDVSS